MVITDVVPKGWSPKIDIVRRRRYFTPHSVQYVFSGSLNFVQRMSILCPIVIATIERPRVLCAYVTLHLLNSIRSDDRKIIQHYIKINLIFYTLYCIIYDHPDKPVKPVNGADNDDDGFVLTSRGESDKKNIYKE